MDATNYSSVTSDNPKYKLSKSKFKKNLLAKDYEALTVKKKKKKKLKEWIELEESAFDKGIFKAVFLLGGPGSGKSTMSQRILAGTASWRRFSNDKIYEFLMRKDNLSLDYKKRTPEQEKNQFKDYYKPSTKKAKKQLGLYIDERLPLIIDRTGLSPKNTLSLKKRLEDVGYETAMLFIDTPLKEARERNANRERSIDFKNVRFFDPVIRKEVPAYKRIFGNNFYHFNNSGPIDSKKEVRITELRKKIYAWMKVVPSNTKVKAWLVRDTKK